MNRRYSSLYENLDRESVIHRLDEIRLDMNQFYPLVKILLRQLRINKDSLSLDENFEIVQKASRSLFLDIRDKVIEANDRRHFKFNVTRRVPDDDQLFGLDGPLDVRNMIGANGEADRAEFDHRMYQTAVNYGELYWKLGLERDEDKMQALKSAIKVATDSLFEQLNSINPKKTFKQRKSELLSQVL